MLGTGWFGAVAAEVGPGKTVVVVGDGAVGLLGVLAAEPARRRADHRHEPPRVPPEAGPGVRRHRHRRPSAATRASPAIKDLTDGLGAHSTIEAVGTRESMIQAIGATRPGGHVGYVGVTHGSSSPASSCSSPHVHLHGGPAPVRRFLPELIDLIATGAIDPGKVFDLTLPLDQAAEGYRAMDERRAIKTLLTL